MKKDLLELEANYQKIGNSALEAVKILEVSTDSLEDRPDETNGSTGVDLWLAAFKDKTRKTFPKVQEILSALSEMPALEYDLIRDKVSKLAGIRVGTLDSEVTKLRPKPKEEKQAVIFEDSSPCEEAVKGGELLDEIVSWINRYLVMDKGASEAVAVWCVASWCLDVLYFAPILAILSATKRSGKSTLLDLVKLVVYRGFLTMGAGITPAILFRTNGKYHPTFLIDEAEKLSGDESAKELIGLLNAGHKKGGTVFRCDPITYEPIPYDAFGFRAVAAIGTLWDTILDRSISIKMTRKTKEADVSRFSAREVEKEGKALASKIARWVEDNREAVGEAEEKTPRPDHLDDRACDNWTPLFAVGMVAGNGWLDRLLDSAKALQPDADENGGRGEILIRDIKGIFSEKGNPSFVSSGDLVDALNLIETSSWGDLRKGQGISARWLSKNLRPFRVLPKHTMHGNGYSYETFRDTFSRYIPPDKPSYLHKDNNINELRGLKPSYKGMPESLSFMGNTIKNQLVMPKYEGMKDRKGVCSGKGTQNERRAIKL